MTSVLLSRSPTLFSQSRRLSSLSPTLKLYMEKTPSKPKESSGPQEDTRKYSASRRAEKVLATARKKLEYSDPMTSPEMSRPKKRSILDVLKPISSSAFYNIERKSKKKERSPERHVTFADITTVVVVPSEKQMNKEEMLEKPTKKRRKEQLFLDFGQRDMIRSCEKCGMLFSPGKEEDEKEHRRFCTRYDRGVTFCEWKSGNKISDYIDGGKVISLEGKEVAKCWRKVLEVLSLSDGELGMDEENTKEIIEEKKRKVFVYVSSLEKKICGLLIAERLNIKGSVRLGVNRIWVHRAWRRKSVATRLLDSARRNFIYGMEIPCDNVAFTQTTRDGTAFANSFAGEDFKVYHKASDTKFVELKSE